MVSLLIDIKSILKDGTPSILVKTIVELRGKEPMETCSPLGIMIDEKEPLLLLLTSKFREEILRFIAPLLIII